MRYLSKAAKGKTLLLGAGVGLALLGLGTPALISADRMESNSYIIQFGNFNITSGTKSGGGYTVTDTVGQTAPGEYASTGYRVFAGFQYIYAIPKFSFRITDLSIDLGELSAGSFFTGTHDLVVTTRSGGYTIRVRADEQLQVFQGSATIPATNCNTSCSIGTAGVWSSPARVGFGYSIAGPNRTADFINGTYFRPFATQALSQSAQVAVSANSVVKNDTHTVTYQVAIAGSQAAGAYSAAIDYTAVPTY